MQLTHHPTKILVTGRSGVGKSTYWTRYLLGGPHRFKFVFDHEGELAYRLRALAATSPEQLAAATADGWAIFDPAAMFPGRLAAGFGYFSELSFHLAARLPGQKLFACDELQKLVNTSQLDLGLALVLETGRRYGLDCLMVAQQPNLIHNRIRNQLTEVVSFQQMDDNALDYLRQAGFDPDALRALRPGQFIARNLQSGAATRGAVF